MTRVTIPSELMTRVAGGDEKAFEELYRLTYRPLFSFLLSMTADHEKAGDLMQETYLRVFKSAGSYRDFGNPMAWIMKIGKRRSYVLAATAAALLILFVSFTVKDARTVDSILYLDVNPSVCISLNEKGDIVSIDGINEDGIRVAKAVNDEIGSGCSLNETVNCIIAEIDEEGYFSKGSVDVLVSLSYMHEDDSAVLEKTCSTIEEYAASHDLKSNLMSRSFARDRDIEEAAADIGISPGKYAFIVSLSDDGSADPEVVREWAVKSAGEIIDKTEKGTYKKTDKSKEEATSGEPKQDVADEAKDTEEDRSDAENSSSEDIRDGNKKSNASSTDNGELKDTKDKDKDKDQGQDKDKDQKKDKDKDQDKDKDKSDNGSGKGGNGSGKDDNSSGKNDNGSGKGNSGSGKDNGNKDNG